MRRWNKSSLTDLFRAAATIEIFYILLGTLLKEAVLHEDTHPVSVTVHFIYF